MGPHRLGRGFHSHTLIGRTNSSRQKRTLCRHPLGGVLNASDTEVELALQSAEAGPQLWIGGAARPWTVEPLPTGRLEAARRHGENLWVLVGGQVWRSPR